MTQLGKFDDFFNNFHFGRILPNPKESYMMSPFLIAFFKIVPTKFKFIQFLIFIFSSLYIYYNSLKKYKIKKIYIILFFLSYPILFSISRGNIDLLASSFLIIFIFNFLKSDLDKSLKFLLISILLKPTNLLFIFLFKFNFLIKNFKLLFIFFIVNLLCILIVSFDVIEYITNYFKMLSNYKDAYVIGGGGSLFNNSSWGFYKWYSLNISFSGNNFFEALSAPQVLPYGVYTEAIDAIKYYLNYFNKISLIFIAISIVLNYLTKNNYLKIIIITLTTILFSPISADYRLINILIIFLILINDFEMISIAKIYKYFMILVLSIVIIPKHFISFWVQSPYEFVPMTINSLINPLMLLIALIISYLFVFKEKTTKV